VPVLGICLGAQLLCQALDGGVHPGADLEVGWHRVEVLEEGLCYAGFDRAGAGFEVFHWHAHVCDPPKGARVLAASACTPVQAFSLGAHLALQFHPEMTAATIRELIETYPEDLEPASACVQDALGILDGIEDKTQRAFKVADQLLSPWFARLKAGAG
jgi:GMP synthase-like glutamine amidotransferase